MENASKALIMAGGILIALLVIGALLLMFNQIGSYEKAQTTSEKNSQLAQFNSDFERYTDDNGIKGVDIISIINKVTDFNNKSGVANSVNYDIKMSVTVDLKNFQDIYQVATEVESMFKSNIVTIKDDNNQKYKYFNQIIVRYTELEKIYTLSVMSMLSSNYTEIIEKMKDKGISENDSQEYFKLIKEITGKDYSNRTDFPKLKEISQYKQYSEFKSATFKSSKNPYYENGQIKDLYFEFVK